MKTFDLRKALLAGTAIVAVGAFATGAQAADEFIIDQDDNNTFGASTENEDSPADLSTFNAHDFQILDDGIINTTDGEAIGDGDDTAAAIESTVTGKTVTINGDGTHDDGLDTVTINGDVTHGSVAALNLTISAVDDGTDGLEDFLVTTNDDNDDIDLGTGTLTIQSVSTSGVNKVALAIAGDLTAGSIVLDHTTSAADAVLAIEGGADQTITGVITGAADNDGTIIVSNAASQTVTFASAVGTADNSVGVLNIGSAADADAGIAAGGGTATFSGAVYVNDINVGATDTGNEDVAATFSGDVVASTFTVDSDAGATTGTVATIKGDLTATIDLDDDTLESSIVFSGTSAQTVTGTIAGASAGEGNVIVGDGTNASNVTFASAIGGTAIDLFQVKSGSSATVSNSVTARGAASAVSIDIDGTLNVSTSDGAVSITDDGTAAADIDIDGTLSITGDDSAGNATIDAVNAAGELFIDGTLTTAIGTAAATTTLGGDGGITIGATSDTTITAGNQIVLSDESTIGASGRTNTLNIRKTTTFTPSATTPVINAGATVVTVNTDAVLNVGIDSASVDFDDGDLIKVIDSSSNATTSYATLLTNGDIVLVDTGLIDLQDNSSDAQDLNIKVVFKDATSSFGAGATGAGAANAIIAQTAAQSATIGGNFDTIRDNLLAATTANAEEIAEAAAPTVDGGAVVAALSASGQSANVTNTRLAALRSGDAQTGMVAGNVSDGLSAWGQVFGSTGEQDDRDGVDGYDVDTFGFAAGIDTETLAEDWVVGLAFSYADSEVDSKNANATNTEIDSYQLTVYGDYALDERTFVSGQLGYVWANNDTLRKNVGGIAGVNASGDFDSEQFIARVEAGRAYTSGENTTITPSILANYVYYDADSYTETGAGTANLTVNPEDLSLFEIGVGVDASWLYQQADGAYLKPELRAGVRHDLIGDEIETNSTFTGGGASFKTQGFDPAQTTFNLGAGVTYYSTSNWELTANYDFEVKSDYDSHAGTLRAAYKF